MKVIAQSVLMTRPYLSTSGGSIQAEAGHSRQLTNTISLASRFPAPKGRRVPKPDRGRWWRDRRPATRKTQSRGVRRGFGVDRDASTSGRPGHQSPPPLPGHRRRQAVVAPHESALTDPYRDLGEGDQKYHDEATSHISWTGPQTFMAQGT